MFCQSWIDLGKNCAISNLFPEICFRVTQWWPLCSRFTTAIWLSLCKIMIDYNGINSDWKFFLTCQCRWGRASLLGGKKDWGRNQLSRLPPRCSDPPKLQASAWESHSNALPPSPSQHWCVAILKWYWYNRSKYKDFLMWRSVKFVSCINCSFSNKNNWSFFSRTNARSQFLVGQMPGGQYCDNLIANFTFCQFDIFPIWHLEIFIFWQFDNFTWLTIAHCGQFGYFDNLKI